MSPSLLPPRRFEGSLIESIRVRLTLWYALGLAVFMGAAAAASYTLLARAMAQRTDANLRATARAFAATWVAQRARSPGRAPMASVRRVDVGALEIVVFDQERRVVASSPDGRAWVEEDLGRAARPDLSAMIGQIATADGVFSTLAGGSEPQRVFAMPLNVGDRRQVVTVAQGLREQWAILSAARNGFLITIPMVLALALAGGYLLARRALAPVAAMASQARRIGSTTLEERLSVRNDRDELGQLARVFNELLDRLARAFDQQRQFVADASHELRTPVAVVRGEAEVALARAHRDPAEYREALELIHEEARRMSRLVDDLFLLARSDAGHQALVPSELYLDELVGECVRSLRTLATTRSMELRHDGGPEMPFRGDEALLRRLVINLIENAIKYGSAHTSVIVRTALRAAGVAGAEHYAITVHNEGPPIPPELQHRVFDRFFRATRAADAASPARGDNEAGGGAGLGLAIGRWITEAHGGRLRLVRSSPSGTEFELTLPTPGAAPATH